MRRDKVGELSLLTVLKENFVRQEVPPRDAVGGEAQLGCFFQRHRRRDKGMVRERRSEGDRQFSGNFRFQLCLR